MTGSAPARREIPRSELVAQLRALGVEEGGVLLVHSSFRAVRPVEAGLRGVRGDLAKPRGLSPHLLDQRASHPAARHA